MTRSWVVVGTIIAGALVVGLGLVTGTPPLAIAGGALVALGVLTAMVLPRLGVRSPRPPAVADTGGAERPPPEDTAPRRRLRDVGGHRYIEIPDDDGADDESEPA